MATGKKKDQNGEKFCKAGDLTRWMRRNMVGENLDAVGETILCRMLAGDTKMIGMVWERLDGKVPDRTEISGIDGKPIASIDLSTLSDEDLKRILSDSKNG